MPEQANSNTEQNGAPVATQPAPVQPTTGAPASVVIPNELPVLQPPGIGTVWVHNRGSIYSIVQYVPGIDFNIIYRRFGDGFTAQLPLARFYERFRAITEAEAELLVAAQPILRSANVAANLSTIANPQAFVPQPAQPAPSVPMPTNPEGSSPSEQQTDNPVDSNQPEVQLQNPSRRRGEEVPEVGLLVEPSERDVFENLILFPEVMATVSAGLRAINQRDAIEARFGISAIQPLANRCGMNFYGPPGTGKTALAKCIARLLGKKLYQVDYAQMISKYYGDTAKHIKAAFDKAREYDAILFWDEADSMLSKRLSMDRDGATTVNQNRNTLMQEMDRFDGIVIFTTNKFGNYDEGLLRRIAKHVEFHLPDSDMRKSIFDKHLPVKTYVQPDIDWALVAFRSDGFGGGDILNVVLNGIEKACMPEDVNQWILTEALLLAECDKIKAAKLKHAEGERSQVARKADRPARPQPNKLVIDDGTQAGAEVLAEDGPAPAPVSLPTVPPVAADTASAALLATVGEGEER